MIRLTIPLTDHREIEEIGRVLASGYLTQGPVVEEFEHRVAALVGCTHAFAMSSCTTALHLALVVLGVGRGDDVAVADFTFPATGNVVAQQGARPVLVDVDPVTFTMDPSDLAAKLTRRTKVILPVHTFGCSADMDAILEIADRRGIPVLEDAACAIGTTYRGRFCGSMGTMGCFSFHPRKVITTGEGGMITTNDPGIAERIRLLRSHGGVREGRWYRYEEAGFNYRLSDVLGAIGLAQMEKLPHLIERKRTLARLLTSYLTDLPNVVTPAEPPWGGHIYQSYVVRLAPGVDRARVMDEMTARGIETTLGTYALHDQPFFQRAYRYREGQLPRSHACFHETMTLPLYPQMEERDVRTVADALRDSLAASRRTA